MRRLIDANVLIDAMYTAKVTSAYEAQDIINSAPTIEGQKWKGADVKCVDCELHDCVVGTHFCNYKGKSGRRKPRRISEEDAHKDVPCEYVEELKGADDE